MDTQTQGHGDKPRTKYVVGMDAHSRKLAISIWEWSDPWNPVLVRNVKCFAISEIKEVYEKHVDLDSITIIEASLNSAMIKEVLFELGFRAEVVKADIIADKERKRKVCDIKDAENLARAYIKGDVEEFVWTPTAKYAKYRSIFFAYRDARKEAQRNWNRIRSLCSANGAKLPEEVGEKFVRLVRKATTEIDLDEFTSERFEMMIADYEYYCSRCGKLDRMIMEIVASEDEMIDLMQLPGFFYMSAFAVKTIVEDAKRFSKGQARGLCRTRGPGEHKRRGRGAGEEERRDRKATRHRGQARPQILFLRGGTDGSQQVLCKQARQVGNAHDLRRQGKKQGRLRSRKEAHGLLLAHHARRPDAQPRGRSPVQAKDAQILHVHRQETTA